MEITVRYLHDPTNNNATQYHQIIFEDDLTLNDVEQITICVTPWLGWMFVKFTRTSDDKLVDGVRHATGYISTCWGTCFEATLVDDRPFLAKLIIGPEVTQTNVTERELVPA